MSQNEINSDKIFPTSSGNDFILHSLIDSGFNLSALKSVFEKGVQSTFISTLVEYISYQQSEIQQLCSTHYEDFLLAISRLNESRDTADSLKQKIKSLNDEVQVSGSVTIESASDLLKHRRTAENIDKTLRTIRWCRVVSLLSMQAGEEIQQSKYFHALETLNRLEKSIQRVRQYSFAKQLEFSIPDCRRSIKESVKGKFNDWLLNVKNNASKVGEFVLKHTQQKMKAASILYDSEYENEDVFNTCNVSFSDVYLCKMIHSKLNLSFEFSIFYKESRKAQISQLIDSLKSKDILSYYNWISGILGFFEVEYHVLKTTDNLITSVEFKKTWEEARGNVENHLDMYFQDTNNPQSFLEMKELVSGFCFALSSRMRLDVQSILDLMQKYTYHFSEIVSKITKGKIREIITHESFIPLIVKSPEEYTNLASKNLVSRTNFQERLKSIRFPITLSFSSTVVDICNIVESHMMQFFQYSQFLTDLDEMIKSSLHDLIEEVGLSLEKLIVGTAYGALGQFAQIAVNAEYLTQACVYFEEVFSKAKKSNITQAMIPEIENQRLDTSQELIFLKLSPNLFFKIRDQAENNIQKFISKKIDELLKCSDKIDWLSGYKNKEEMHPFADDLMTYLNATLQVISIIPREKVESITFYCAQHISNSLLDILGGIDILTLESLKVVQNDIHGLKSSLQLYDRNSSNCFLELETIIRVIVEINFSSIELQSDNNQLIERLLQEYGKLEEIKSEYRTRILKIFEKFIVKLKKYDTLKKAQETKPQIQKKSKLGFKIPFVKK